MSVCVYHWGSCVGSRVSGWSEGSRPHAPLGGRSEAQRTPWRCWSILRWEWTYRDHLLHSPPDPNSWPTECKRKQRGSHTVAYHNGFNTDLSTIMLSHSHEYLYYFLMIYFFVLKILSQYNRRTWDKKNIYKKLFCLCCTARLVSDLPT